MKGYKELNPQLFPKCIDTEILLNPVAARYLDLLDS